MRAEETRPEQQEGTDRQNTSTVGVDRAMRARDVSRPTPSDVAQARERLSERPRARAAASGTTRRPGARSSPTSVSLPTGEIRRQEDVHEARGVLDRVHAGANRHHVGVVMFPREPGRVIIPRKRGTYALDLVGRDLLPVPGAPDDEPKTVRIGDGGRRRPPAKGRIVVLGVVTEGSVVNNLVTLRPEVLRKGVLQLEPGMIGSHVDAHGPSLAGRSRDAMAHFGQTGPAMGGCEACQVST